MNLKTKNVSKARNKAKLGFYIPLLLAIVDESE